MGDLAGAWVALDAFQQRRLRAAPVERERDQARAAAMRQQVLDRAQRRLDGDGLAMPEDVRGHDALAPQAPDVLTKHRPWLGAQLQLLARHRSWLASSVAGVALG